MDTIQIAATVMLTFVIFWLSLTERRMKGWRLIVLWVVSVCLAAAIIGASLIKERQVAAQAASKVVFRVKVVAQIAKAEALGKEIPKGCPKGVDHKPWAKKVEDWRTETSRIPGLEQTFPADKGDYPHGRDCRIEWVRNRLDYFAGKLDAIAAALVGPR